MGSVCCWLLYICLHPVLRGLFPFKVISRCFHRKQFLCYPAKSFSQVTCVPDPIPEYLISLLHEVVSLFQSQTVAQDSGNQQAGTRCSLDTGLVLLELCLSFQILKIHPRLRIPTGQTVPISLTCLSHFL